MSSFSQKFNPRANVFLVVNLGCEMVYVIDQRLKAQQIPEDKSAQVIHDITSVLLDSKFIDSLIVGSTQANSLLLPAEQCKFMLNDIATCSLMRLDDKSMEKLWNLMTMIYKWQLFLSEHEHHLLDITFRHLHSVRKLYPDEQRNVLIDFTKHTLLDFWNICGEEDQLSIYRTNKAWLEFYNTKISLLIRLGFQALDGSFFPKVDATYFRDFVDTIGDNVYTKSVDIVEQYRSAEMASSSLGQVDQLAEMLNFQLAENENSKPVEASKRFEQNLQQCNVLFEDMGVGGAKYSPSTSSSAGLDMNLFPDSSMQSAPEEFVQLKPVYNRNTEASSGPSTSAGIGLNKDLLDLYSKMN